MLQRRGGHGLHKQVAAVTFPRQHIIEEFKTMRASGGKLKDDDMNVLLQKFQDWDGNSQISMLTLQMWFCQQPTARAQVALQNAHPHS
jgi:hypothetical protein